MTANPFRDRLRSQPFRPFDVKTAGGDTFRVSHADFAMISPNETEVIIYDRDNHFRVVSMNLIVSLEPAREPATRKPGKR
jgi:hypothetical protein